MEVILEQSQQDKQPDKQPDEQPRISRIVEAIIYDATVPNFASDDNHTNKFYTSTGVPIEVSLLIAIAAGENAIQLCREGAVPVITIWRCR